MAIMPEAVSVLSLYFNHCANCLMYQNLVRVSNVKMTFMILIELARHSK